MNYLSTRGQSGSATSSQAIIEGIAPDGGLFVPWQLPSISLEQLEPWARGPYPRLAAGILQPYLDFQLQELEAALDCAYSSFAHPAVCPVVQLAENLGVLELWHGPTFAFKDMALQALPQLLTLAKAKAGEEKTQVILVATSGDTGKAALEGFCDVAGTEVIVFYPKGGVSPLQELQMVTQRGNNVCVIAVEGNFDHAQSGVKALLQDQMLASELERRGYSFSSANSINPGRLLPQIAYYFKAYLEAVKLGIVKWGAKLNFVVPTGNFGNILAAYYAKQSGLPVGKLICASNANRVLTNFFRSGTYDRRLPFYKTNSPSMDILISSNLERLLFEISDRDSDLISKLMEQLAAAGHYQIPPAQKQSLDELFWADYADEAETVAQIKTTYKERGYCLDPHTAVAMAVYAKYEAEFGLEPTVVVSTASPYKFPRTVAMALGIEGESEFELLAKLADKIGLPLPEGLVGLESEQIRHKQVIEPGQMAQAVREALAVEG